LASQLVRSGSSRESEFHPSGKNTEEEFRKKTAKEIVLTLDEIAAKFGIGEGAKLVIVKGASGVGMTMQEAWG
jgi:hypothetical protein